MTAQMNNMSARGTYQQVWHLRRTMSHAARIGNRRWQAVCAHLIQGYMESNPVETFNALESHVNRGATR